MRWTSYDPSMDVELPDLGLRISTARRAANLSREKLSEQVGVTEKSIQRYEEGKQRPRLATLKKLAPALNTSVAELMRAQGVEEGVSLDDVLKSQRAILVRLDELTELVREIGKRL